MKVGFTGASRGLTAEQVRALHLFLAHLEDEVEEVHHGDCVGGDATAHDHARMCGLRVVTHPPDDPRLRAYKVGDEARPEKDYKARDRDIVAEVDVLVACPEGTEKSLPRSGTWYTVRQARKARRPVWLIMPDGSQGFE